MQRSVTLISLVGRKKQLKTADVRKSVETYRYVEVATGMKTAVKAIISILKLDWRKAASQLTVPHHKASA